MAKKSFEGVQRQWFEAEYTRRHNQCKDDQATIEEMLDRDDDGNYINPWVRAQWDGFRMSYINGGPYHYNHYVIGKCKDGKISFSERPKRHQYISSALAEKKRLIELQEREIDEDADEPQTYFNIYGCIDPEERKSIVRREGSVPQVTLAQIMEKMGISPDYCTFSEMKRYLVIIDKAQTLSREAGETLKAMYDHGPLFDGDLTSKVGRDELANKQFCTRIVVKGDQGYNAVTADGVQALRVVKCYTNFE